MRRHLLSSSSSPSHLLPKSLPLQTLVHFSTTASSSISSDPAPSAAAADASSDSAASSDPLPSDSATSADASASDSAASSGERRRPRAAAPADEPLHETIVYMMRRRPWTTRLQNSLRLLCPYYTTDLVLAVLRSAAAAGRPDLALRFFRFAERSAGFRHDAATFGYIIPLLASHRMLNHARCLLLESMPARGVAIDEPTISSLIAAYGKSGIPQESVKLFRRMPELGVPRTNLSYDAFLKAILCRGRTQMAKRVFNAMLADGVTPQLSTYNILVWGFCLSSKMETATRFFADMQSRGAAPDVVTYNTLLNGWVRIKDLENARKVFDEMPVNSVSYNIMIKGYVTAGDVDAAIKLFGEMGEKGLRLSEKTFAALMPGLCDDEKRAGEARKALEEMAERRLTPKDKSVFLRLVSTLCRSGDLDGAMKVHLKTGRFKHVVVDPMQYEVLIESLCGGKKYDSAVEVLDELLEKGTMLNPASPALKASAYNPIIEHLCGNDNTNKAEVFFRQLMKKGVDDKVAFNNLIRGHAKEGTLEAAQEILAIMTRHGVPTDAESYVLLVDSYLKKGEPADARTALDSMMEQGHMPSPALFRSVLVALFNDGRVQTASRVMKSMIEKGVTENMDLVHKILEALFMRGHLEEALGRINLMVENGCAPDLNKLLVVLCENDRAMEAQKLVDFGLDRDYDMSFSTYDRVLEALYTEGKTLPAYSILCKIKKKGGVVDKKGCDALVQSLNAEGNTKQADILSRILQGDPSPMPKRGKRAVMAAF